MISDATRLITAANAPTQTLLIDSNRYFVGRCRMMLSWGARCGNLKKVVGDDAIMVNPTMLASWGTEPPYTDSPRRGRRMISTASSPRTSSMLRVV